MGIIQIVCLAILVVIILVVLAIARHNYRRLSDWQKAEARLGMREGILDGLKLLGIVVGFFALLLLMIGAMGGIKWPS